MIGDVISGTSTLQPWQILTVCRVCWYFVLPIEGLVGGVQLDLGVQFNVGQMTFASTGVRCSTRVQQFTNLVLAHGRYARERPGRPTSLDLGWHLKIQMNSEATKWASDGGRGFLERWNCFWRDHETYKRFAVFTCIHNQSFWVWGVTPPDGQGCSRGKLDLPDEQSLHIEKFGCFMNWRCYLTVSEWNATALFSKHWDVSQLFSRM